jgi:hypothetical protein
VKFHEAYQDAVHGNRDRLDGLLAQDVPQWVGHQPNGAFYPAIDAEQRYDIRTCQVWLQHLYFVEAQAAMIAQVNSQIGINQYRHATAQYLTAMPVPDQYSDWYTSVGTNNLTLVAQHNERYWGLHSLAALCTTTTTTTLPPCPCAGNHPDMRVTVSGLSANSNTWCRWTGSDACNVLNRTWCLLFRGYDNGWGGLGGSVWYRDQYIRQCFWEARLDGLSCGAGWWNAYAVRVLLTYPTPPWGATDSCAWARLNLGDAANYMCDNFNPDTGGTFTLEYDNNLCAGVPTTLTVTAQAGCTTTTTTTSTSTTTGAPGP